jgi:thioredoxin 1
MIKEITPDELDSLICSGTTVVDFWAPDCGRCHALRAQFEMGLERRPDLGDILAVNARQDPDFAERMGVMSLPTVLIFRDRVEVRRFTDPILSTDVLDQWREINAS